MQTCCINVYKTKKISIENISTCSVTREFSLSPRADWRADAPSRTKTPCTAAAAMTAGGAGQGREGCDHSTLTCWMVRVTHLVGPGHPVVLVHVVRVLSLQ